MRAGGEGETAGEGEGRGKVRVEIKVNLLHSPVLLRSSFGLLLVVEGKVLGPGF